MEYVPSISLQTKIPSADATCDELPPYSAYGGSNIPALLPASETVVTYQAVPMDVRNCRHTLKAISTSNKSVSTLINILGTYVNRKTTKETWLIPDGVPFHLRYSRPSLRKYVYIMHKLETLSGKVLNHYQVIQTEWEEALGLFRRQVFAELYNDNNVVRCFATEIPESPLTLPTLDEYALGLRHGQYWYQRSGLRSADPLSLLSKVRTVILLNDNISMTSTPAFPNNPSQMVSSAKTGWSQAHHLLAEVAPKVSKYNRRGIDIHFVNQPAFYAGVHTAPEVNEVFNTVTPCTTTYNILSLKLVKILDGYISTLYYYRNLLPLNLLVITNITPDHEESLMTGIEERLSHVQKLGFPAHQIGIEFVQVEPGGRVTRKSSTMDDEVARHREKFRCDCIGLTRISVITGDLLLAISLSGFDARLNGYIR